MTPETTKAAIRWAKAGAILNPGIKFIAIVDDRMYAYEEPIDHKGRRIT